MALVRRLVLALVAGLFWASHCARRNLQAPSQGRSWTPPPNSRSPTSKWRSQELRTRSSARSDGSFALNGVAAGSYRLRASRIGYVSQIQEITVTPAEPRRRTSASRRRPPILEPVVVTGYAPSRREAITGSVSTVSAAAANVGRGHQRGPDDQARRPVSRSTRIMASRAPARRS